MPRTVKIAPEVLALAQNSVMSIVRFHMMANRVSFRQLAQMLNDAGVEENERNLRAKVARGEMQASFFLMCLKLLGCEKISLEEIPIFRDDPQIKVSSGI